MRIRSVLLCLCLSVLVLSLAQPAAAQREGNWAIGYSLLGNNTIAANTSVLPLGWMGSGAVALSDGVSWAFDVSGNYAAGIDVCGGVESRAIGTASQPAACLEGVIPATASDEFQGYSNMRAEAQWCSPTLSKCDVKALSVGGFTGPRFGPTGGSVRPYVHLMGGVVRSARVISFYSHTSTNWAFQPGAGVDVDVTDNVAVRLQGDMRYVLFSDSSQAGLQTGGDDYKEFRFSFGFVFALGG